MSTDVLKAEHINKYFYSPSKYKVLDDLKLEVNSGDFISIVGKSGCGKSTLLYILSTMDTDYEGELTIDNILLTGKSDVELARVRNEKIGFVFQFHYLLDEYNVLKNVMLPAIKLAKYTMQEIEHNAYEQLKSLDMHEHALKKPSQLSGGQKQRVAIARAMINQPIIIMGDEPTGNLDKKNSDMVFDIFNNLVKTNNQTMLIVTHDNDFASRTHKTITMNDGKMV